MLKNLLYVLLLLAAFPIALILSNICSDEIKKWRERFTLMSISCLILALIINFTNFDYKFPTTIALIFIILTNLVLIWKSY